MDESELLAGEPVAAQIRASEPPSSPPAAHRRPSERVLATVYDATSGKPTYERKPSRAALSLPPEEVLFRRKDAPALYAEHHIYRSHERDLPRSGRGVLPESELLRAVHSYASRFYGALERRSETATVTATPTATSTATGTGKGLGAGGMGGCGVDERSMDETALLAFGVLLEEAGREVLGRRGHLVFTEAGGEPDVMENSGGGACTVPLGPSGTASRRVGSNKRRKLAVDEDE